MPKDSFEAAGITKLAKAAVGLGLIILLGAVLWHRPFWGLMDDHLNAFELVPAMNSRGVLRFASEYDLQDLEWGMFRPTYPLMVFALYWPAIQTAPWVLFLWNAVWVGVAIYLIARVNEVIIGANRWLILLFCGCFFYFYDLFQHPSLQEKMLHIVGGLLLLTARKFSFRGVACFTFLAVVGALIKASFLVYLCMAVWIAYWAQPGSPPAKRFISAIPSLVALVGSLVFFFIISKNGSYTSSRLALNNVLPNASSLAGISFGAICVIYAAWCVAKRRAVRQPVLLTPLIGLAAFLTLFLPWSIQGYLQTLPIPLAATICTLMLQSFQSRTWRWAGALGAAAFGVLICAYRSDLMFARLGDIGRVVERAPSLYSQGVSEVLMSCQEGSAAVNRFFEKAAKVQIHTQLKQSFVEAPRASIFALYDSSVCPWVGPPLPLSCAEEILVPPSRRKSFKLVKVSCK